MLILELNRKSLNMTNQTHFWWSTTGALVSVLMQVFYAHFHDCSFCLNCQPYGFDYILLLTNCDDIPKVLYWRISGSVYVEFFWCVFIFWVKAVRIRFRCCHSARSISKDNCVCETSLLFCAQIFSVKFMHFLLSGTWCWSVLMHQVHFTKTMEFLCHACLVRYQRNHPYNWRDASGECATKGDITAE